MMVRQRLWAVLLAWLQGRCRHERMLTDLYEKEFDHKRLRWCMDCGAIQKMLAKDAAGTEWFAGDVEVPDPKQIRYRVNCDQGR